MEDYFIGIEIGGTKTQAATVAPDGGIIERLRLQVDKQGGSKGILEQIRDSIEKLTIEGSPRGLGIGFGGPVDWRSGRIIKSHHIQGWDGFDLAGWIKDRVECPVRIDNDANVAALGEAAYGAGKGHSPLLYITLGSGVGGGLVVDGRIYHGAVPGEVEIGHVRLDRNGRIVEEACSGWAVDAKIRALADVRSSSKLCSMAGQYPGNEARHLVAALNDGDRLAWDILDEISDDLAFGVSHAVHLLHPAIVVLGGGLTKIGEQFRACVAEKLPNYLMDAFKPGPCVALSALKDDVVPVGAMALNRSEGIEKGFR
ncbi:MAG: ROK family protein [Verrucomicrobia bacterium]|nr:ROK family protein [Verrucomicrobiota bacterium]MCF7708006.1 ROK family protein [Verrucomicrobiota bacterium]